MTRSLTLSASLAGLLIGACDSGTDIAAPVAHSQVNVMLRDGDPTACVHDAVLNRLENHSRDLDMTWRGWNQSEQQAWLDQMRLEMANTTNSSYDPATARMVCATDLTASDGIETFSRRFEYTIQPLLDRDDFVMQTDRWANSAVASLASAYRRRVEEAERASAPPPDVATPRLDFNALAGPDRSGTYPSPTPRPTPPRPTPAQTRSQGGSGRAAEGHGTPANGPQLAAIFNQVHLNWMPPCEIPGADQLRIEMDVTLSTDGRIISGPTLREPRSDTAYRAAADSALRATRESAPFDVPQGFPGGDFRPTFNLESACRNR